MRYYVVPAASHTANEPPPDDVMVKGDPARAHLFSPQAGIEAGEVLEYYWFDIRQGFVQGA
jgi:hypothetical protein